MTERRMFTMAKQVASALVSMENNDHNRFESQIPKNQKFSLSRVQTP